MMSHKTKLAALGFLLAPLVGLNLGCESQGPAEKAGAAIDDAADDLKDAVDPRGPAEKAGDKLDEAAGDLKDAVDPRSPAEKAGAAIDDAADKVTNP